MPSPKEVRDLIEGAGGKVTAMDVGSDGHGFAIASFPLPKNHWSKLPGDNVPPMPMQIGVGPERDALAEKVRAAVRYAYRASTMNGQDEDIDPDALIQNVVVGLLGYRTPTGFGSEPWMNPPDASGSGRESGAAAGGDAGCPPPLVAPPEATGVCQTCKGTRLDPDAPRIRQDCPDCGGTGCPPAVESSPEATGTNENQPIGKCPTCGVPVYTDEGFCGNCGRREP